MFPSANIYALKLSNPQVAHFFMFPSQIVRLKIVEPRFSHFLHVSLANGTALKIVEPLSGPLCPCFPHKWYALKLSNSQVAHFFHVSLANGLP